jgi:N6-adenosine-specific RNA methylase IME4
VTRPARIVIADPPWSYRNRHDTRGKSRFGRGVATRYSRGVMTIDDLCALGPLVEAACASDAYLFLWATPPTMPDAIRLLEAWGFRYVSIAFYWTKLYPSGAPFFGPGRYVPANVEPVLLGVRGRCWHTNRGPKPLQEIRAPHPRDGGRIIHSRKPDALHERIETWLGPQRGDSDMLELFATRPRAGWACYGYDVTGSDIRDDLAAHARALAPLDVPIMIPAPVPIST